MPLLALVFSLFSASYFLGLFLDFFPVAPGFFFASLFVVPYLALFLIVPRYFFTSFLPFLALFLRIVLCCVFACFLRSSRWSLLVWRTIGAKIQLLNFACTFGIRCCSFTICTYICNSTFKFAISLFQLTI